MKIAAFNVRIFGERKMRNKMVQDVLVKVGVKSNVFSPFMLTKISLSSYLVQMVDPRFSRGVLVYVRREELLVNLFPHFLAPLFETQRNHKLYLLTNLFVSKLGYFEVRCNTYSGNSFKEQLSNQ